MDMFNLINIMDISCAPGEPLGSVAGIVGYVIWGIKVVVPIILIIVGMLDMVKAMTGKDETAIKTVQNALIKKLIAAVIVFLVPTIVTILMTMIGSEDFKKCGVCVNNPTQCKVVTDLD